MVRKPDFIPKVWSSILTRGAKELVVQLALEMILSDFRRVLWFTPRTIVLILSSLAGAERSTRLAPAARCFVARGVVKNLPVHSRTMSTLCFFQGSCAGSFCA